MELDWCRTTMTAARPIAPSGGARKVNVVTAPWIDESEGGAEGDSTGASSAMIGNRTSASSLLSRRVDFHVARRTDVPPEAKYRPINKPVDKSMDGSVDKRAGQTAPGTSAAVVPLCPPGLVESLMDWDVNRRVGSGLVNLGNTCFLNSTLQCLTHTPPLAQYLLSGHHARECAQQGFCLMCELQSHVARALGKGSASLSPSKIVGKLKLIARHLRFGHQEDAHEFMCYFLEGLQKSSVAAAAAARRIDVSRVPIAQQDTTIINRIFGGSLRSRITCKSCGATSDKMDPFLDLSLEVARLSSVDHALAHFTATERLRGDNRYKCGKCNKLVDADKKLSIDRAPPVLVVQLKRFDGLHHGGKITNHVAYGEKLDLLPFVSDRTQGDVSYSLHAVLVHRGSTVHSGHYYCFVKAPNGIWHAMNDADVHRVSLDAVKNQQAYMLFYSRNGVARDFRREQQAVAAAVAKSRDTKPERLPKAGGGSRVSDGDAMEGPGDDTLPPRQSLAEKPRKAVVQSTAAVSASPDASPVFVQFGRGRWMVTEVTVKRERVLEALLAHNSSPVRKRVGDDDSEEEEERKYKSNRAVKKTKSDNHTNSSASQSSSSVDATATEKSAPAATVKRIPFVGRKMALSMSGTTLVSRVIFAHCCISA